MKKQSNPLPPTTREQRRCEVSLFELKKAFTEWARQCQEDPEGFMPEAKSEHLWKVAPKAYGDACAPYFMRLIDEIIKQRKQK